MRNYGGIDEELVNRLRKLEIEDFLWIILIGLVILSLYTNEVERHFLIYQDEVSKNRYRHWQIFIFAIAACIYLYYTIDSYQDLVSLKEDSTPKRVSHTYLSLVSSLAILLAGIIPLYIAITDTDVETEIALN